MLTASRTNLRALRKDLGDREGIARDREDIIHKLQLEVQQLATQLSSDSGTPQPLRETRQHAEQPQDNRGGVVQPKEKTYRT